MSEAARPAASSASAQPLVQTLSLSKGFEVSRPDGWRRRRVRTRAVEGVSLEIRRGETLGLVGESGCGKSTLARLILRLIDPSRGQIVFEGEDVTEARGRRLRRLRRDMQMVFQDPYASLNPRQTISEIIGTPFAVHRTERDRKARVRDLMSRVGLNPEHYNRYPHEFSGGQRQRVGVARALALRPKLIVCDEPVSSLDVSVQAQILNLLQSLQADLGLTYLFISHDLGVVRHVSDRVAVMYLGRIGEEGPAEAVYGTPKHPYTASLRSALPQPTATGASQRVVLRGDAPSPAAPPRACPFHPRCPKARPLAADDGQLPRRCITERPALEPPQAAHHAACWYPLALPNELQTAQERW